MSHSRLFVLAALGAALALTLACGADGGAVAADGDDAMLPGVPLAATDGDHGVALFAGGCFWCIESAYDDRQGVVSAVSGYAGGEIEQPTYRMVGGGRTKHAEVVRVVFDPKVVSYAELVDVFWHNIDPWQAAGQFCDKGPQYRSAIFALDADQRRVAEETKAAVAERFGREPVTEINDGAIFWPAEGYHQDFRKTNPVRYISYRTGCGRDRRLQEIWGDEAAH